MPKKAATRRLPFKSVTEQDLLREPLVRAAFNRLIGCGVNKENLLKLLVLIPFAGDRMQPVVDGMSDRKLRELPKQMRQLAAAIRQVHTSPWLCVAQMLKVAQGIDSEHLPKPLNRTLSPECVEPDAKSFAALPDILTLYAAHLEEWLKTFTWPKWAGIRRGTPIRTYFTLQLLKQVRDSSGNRPHYEDVATLLEAAYKCAGAAATIDSEKLKKLEKNNSAARSIILFMSLQPERFS